MNPIRQVSDQIVVLDNELFQVESGELSLVEFFNKIKKTTRAVKTLLVFADKVEPFRIVG